MVWMQGVYCGGQSWRRTLKVTVRAGLPADDWFPPHRSRSASRTSFFWSSGLPSEPVNATGFVLCWLERKSEQCGGKKQFVQLSWRNLKSVHEVLFLGSASAVKQLRPEPEPGSSEQTAYFHTLLEKFTQNNPTGHCLSHCHRSQRGWTDLRCESSSSDSSSLNVAAFSLCWKLRCKSSSGTGPTVQSELLRSALWSRFNTPGYL